MLAAKAQRSNRDFAIAVAGSCAIIQAQLMNEWNIQSRSHVCQACEKAFANKQPYHTVLIEEKQQYQRLDICPACWDSQYREGASERKGFISQWQGIYHAPPAAPVEAIQKESAESLLRKLIEANDPKYGPVCYILAVMLERKRILKVKEQIKSESGRVFIYEHAGTGDIFTIADPNLQLDQLQEVQHDTAQLLAHGLNPPPVDSAPAAAPEPTPTTVESLGANP
jgi:hypothetical protein